MDKIIGLVGGLPNLSSRNDDDFSDRLSYRYTSAMLLAFALVVSTKQYVGDPIDCWAPAHFTGNWVEYMNNYCWIKNTYYLPLEDRIPKEHEDDQRHMVTYYQWVPLILAIQALIFYMPVMLWRTLNSHSGIDVNNLVETAETVEATNDNRVVKYMVHMMDRYLESQREFKTGCTISLKHCLSRTLCLFCGRQHGNYLVALYLFCKIIFIVNVLSQLFLLNTFLGTDYHFYGIDVLRSLAAGMDWTQSPRFPRITMCDFKVRRLGNLQRYTVQCVLPINLFNEKIFLFIWFWLVFVAALTCFSLLIWTLRSVFNIDHHRYVKKHLELMNRLEEQDKKLCRAFVDKYLKQDGVFVLRLIGHNTNAITVTEFVCSLWDNYRSKATRDSPHD